MKRGFLRWFYVAVQFVMLAVSIPKVATLFHAYDAEVLGPLVGGVDIRSWLVGIAIDLCAAFTTWAAMAKFDESRKRTALFAPALIILFCTALSVIANYEDAATLVPEQYASVSLFTHPALLINPLLISAPPVLVLLLILLVPSVLARPRLKTAEEIAAAAAEQEALIAANARVREAKVRASAAVRSAQVSGFADTMSAVAKHAGLATAVSSVALPDDLLDNEEPRAPELTESAPFPLPEPQVTRAMWKSMPLKERVVKSGIISPQEVSEALGVSLTRARELIKEVRIPEEEKRTVAGRTGAPYQALIDTLYARRTNDSFAQAQKLERTLGVRKRVRQLHIVTSEANEANEAEALERLEHVEDEA